MKKFFPLLIFFSLILLGNLSAQHKIAPTNNVEKKVENINGMETNTVTLRPNASTMWTGEVWKNAVGYCSKVDGQIKVGAGTLSTSRGWALWNTSSIPNNATIVAATIEAWCSQTSSSSSHRIVVKQLLSDPRISDATNLYNNIGTASNIFATNWNVMTSSGYSSINYNSTGISALQAAVSSGYGYHGAGFMENGENDPLGVLDGWNYNGGNYPEPMLHVTYTLPSPEITVSTGSLSSFGTVLVGSVSSVKNYTIQGANLTSQITVSAPTGYRVSTNSGSGFSSSLTLIPSGGTVTTKTIYTRFEPTNAQVYSGNITNSSPGATTRNVAVTGEGVNPPCTLSVNSINPNSGVVIQVSGQNNGTTPFIRILNSGTHVDLTAPLSAGGHYFLEWRRNNTVITTNTTIGFNVDEDQTWTAVYETPPPSISVNPSSLSFGNVGVGSCSSPQSYSISGSNLTSTIDIHSPTGFEISGNGVTGWGNWLYYTPSNGSVSATVYVRFCPTLVQNYSGNITNTSNGATQKNVTVSGTGVYVIPNSPSNLNASTQSSTQINLSWTDNSNNETGFKMERKTGSGGNWNEIVQVGANTTNYNDNGLASNIQYYYRVRAYNSIGNSDYSNEAGAIISSVKDLQMISGLPEKYLLSQNYPNPFNPTSTIVFGLAEESNVYLKVYDLLGNEVMSLLSGESLPAGYYSYSLNAENLSSGIYLYSVTVVSPKGLAFKDTKKMILIK